MIILLFMRDRRFFTSASTCLESCLRIIYNSGMAYSGFYSRTLSFRNKHSFSVTELPLSANWTWSRDSKGTHLCDLVSSFSSCGGIFILTHFIAGNNPFHLSPWTLSDRKVYAPGRNESENNLNNALLLSSM